MKREIYTILSTDCLGDALPKLNANFLMFDTLACNASNTEKSLQLNSNNLQADVLFISDAFSFVLQNCNLFNTVYEVTKELYKYWGNQLTVYVPQHYIAPNINNTAELIRTSFLNKNYAPTQYSPFIIANVIKTNFNRAPWKGSNVAGGVISSLIQVKELSHTIYRYINISNNWFHMETINCETADSPITLQNVSAENLILNVGNVNTYDTYLTVDVTASLSGVAGPVSFTANDYISWEWSISDTLASLPISGVSKTNSSLNLENLNLVTAASSITLYIEQGSFNDVTTLSTLNIIAYNYSDNNMRVGSTTFVINDKPSKDLLDIYFTIDQEGIIIGDSNLTTITRNVPYLSYTLAPYLKSTPQTEQYSLQWVVKTPTRTSIVRDRLLNLHIREEGLTTVTLCAYDVYLDGWGEKWDISKTVKFYQFSSTAAAPTFFVCPTRAWNVSAQQFVDIDFNNYLTYCTAPTAYAYRKDLTETFNLSATQGYDLYVWSIASKTLSSTNNITTIDIPYADGLYLSDGAVVSLTAYNEYYPASNKDITYKIRDKTYVYPITSSTDINSTDSFKRSPKIVPYDEIKFEYGLNMYDFDLSTNSKIITFQNISTANSLLPTKIVSGNVYYSLYNCDWHAVATTTPNDTTADLFCLKQGDPRSILTVDPTNITNLKLSAVASLITHVNDPQHPRDTVLTHISYAPTRY